MHGRMHPNYCQITNLLVVVPLSSLAYPMMIHLLPVANKQFIVTLVAKQLPTKYNTMSCMNTPSIVVANYAYQNVRPFVYRLCRLKYQLLSLQNQSQEQYYQEELSLEVMLDSP